METIVGFVAGYLVGSREGREGLARIRSSWHAIRTSPELRRLAGEAMTVAGATVGNVTEVLTQQAAGPRRRAA
jgi:hypothetical protein